MRVGIINKLFVYGTLAPGRPNEHILKRFKGRWEDASIRGYLHQQGWGAELGYPGIVLDDEGDMVTGFLFSCNHLAELWPVLDDFEGSEYQRVITKAELRGHDKQNQKFVDAYVYVLINIERL